MRPNNIMGYASAIVSNIGENGFPSRRAVELNFVPSGALILHEVAPGPQSYFTTTPCDAFLVDIFLIDVGAAAYMHPPFRLNRRE